MISAVLAASSVRLVLFGSMARCEVSSVACGFRHLRVTADLVARYGGEEFVLVLPSTDLAGTHAACDRLRSEVAALYLPHDKSTHGVVTVSIGFTAVVPMESDDPQRHIALADAALYEAKRAGRNRVVSALS